MAVSLLVLFCILCLTWELQTTSIIPWSHRLTNDSVNYLRLNVTCPPDKPFELNNGTHYLCVVSCGPDLVSEGSKCINVTKCTKPVLSDGMCMDICPEGFVYLDSKYDYNCGHEYSPCSYTVNDIKNTPCVRRSHFITYVTLSTITSIVYIIFIWAFFSMRMTTATKFINWFKSATNKRTRLTDVEEL